MCVSTKSVVGDAHIDISRPVRIGTASPRSGQIAQEFGESCALRTALSRLQPTTMSLSQTHICFRCMRHLQKYLMPQVWLNSLKKLWKSVCKLASLIPKAAQMLKGYFLPSRLIEWILMRQLQSDSRRMLSFPCVNPVTRFAGRNNYVRNQHQVPTFEPVAIHYVMACHNDEGLTTNHLRLVRYPC